MYPHERSLVAEMKQKPFALVGVNSDEDLDDIRRIVVEKDLTWRSFQNTPDGGTSISSAWNVSGWPTLYVFDEERRIHYIGHDGDAAIVLVKELVADLERRRRG